MSNSSVKFLNIKNFEVDLNSHCKIAIEYVVDKAITITHNDWIAIYPHGSNLWNSINLDLMVAYEFVLNCPIRKDERRYKMEFSLKGAKNLKFGQKYQFVYISRSSDIYGISETFEFRPPALNEISSKSNVSHESDDTSKENSEDNPARVNHKKRKAKRRNQQLLLKVESDKSESEDKGGSGDQNKRDAKKFINKFNKNRQVFVKRQTDTCSNNVCGVHRMPPPISCSNCHRVEGLLRTQGELYNKIKNLAEINSDLRNQVGHLQRRVELSQAACQKLSVTLVRERQAKQFFQAAAYERAEYEYQIMVVEPFVPGVFVPTSRAPIVPGRHRAEDKAKGYSVLKLKAIIGNQEEKIRNLTKEIAHLKVEGSQRVVAVVRDNEEINNFEKHPTEKSNEMTREEASSSSDVN